MGTAALGATLGGCLLPQDDGLLEPLHQLNQSPRIVQSVTKANGTVGAFVTLQTGCDLVFEAVVEDRDVDDQIRFRWYTSELPVAGRPERLRGAPEADGTLRNDGTERRAPERIEFKRGATGNPLREPGLYHVEFMAFDGFLHSLQGPGSVPDPDTIARPDGGVRLNPRYSVFYVWTVLMEDGDCASSNTP